MRIRPHRHHHRHRPATVPPGDREAIFEIGILLLPEGEFGWGESRGAANISGDPPVAELVIEHTVDLPAVPVGSYYVINLFTELRSYGGSPSQLSLGDGLIRLELRPVEGHLAADVNCDAAVNGLDAAAFTLALLDPAAYAEQFPYCDDAADLNADGTVDGLDAAFLVDRLLNH